MKVLHVVPSYYPAHVYGGPIQSVHHLNHALAKAGAEIRVLTTDANGKNRLAESGQTIEFVPGLRVTYCRKQIGPDISLKLLKELPSQIRWADVVHLTAVYSFTTIPTLILCRWLNKPVVWSPRGAFQSWQGTTHRMTKKAWNWICRCTTPQKTIMHVSSDREKQATESRMNGMQARVIPNGVALPSLDLKTKVNDGHVRFLFVGRLHPIKGIENLLEACALLSKQRVDFLLKIAGGGNPSYATALQDRVARLGLAQRVEFLGHIDEAAKGRLFADSDVLVLPSYSENFGMAVAEALAHGLPVIASRNTPWEHLDREGCGYWVPNSPLDLSTAMLKMMTSDIASMGKEGRRWMGAAFSWEHCASQMLMCYREMAG